MGDFSSNLYESIFTSWKEICYDARVYSFKVGLNKYIRICKSFSLSLIIGKFIILTKHDQAKMFVEGLNDEYFKAIKV